MATEAQATANAANAQYSTGPRTIPGRAQSALNSLRHGLTAKTVLLPNEDLAEYQAFAVAMHADLGPDNVLEFSLAQELISLEWRLQRVPALEARILSADRPRLQSAPQHQPSRRPDDPPVRDHAQGVLAPQRRPHS